MSDERNGVERAADAAAPGQDFAAGAKALAMLFGVNVQFLYNCRRKGWFPLDRARQVSDTYGIPLVDLVKADVRAALIANQ